MKKILLFVASLLPWFLSSLFVGNNDFYRTINKPFFALPDFAYGIVWTILYVLMGISSALIYNENRNDKNKALLTYGISLFFNFTWSLIFFNMRNFFFAFIWIIFLFVSILQMNKFLNLNNIMN